MESGYPTLASIEYSPERRGDPLMKIHSVLFAAALLFLSATLASAQYADVNRGITGADVNRGITGADVNRGITGADVNRGITGADVNRGITGADVNRGITAADVNRPY